MEGTFERRDFFKLAAVAGSAAAIAHMGGAAMAEEADEAESTMQGHELDADENADAQGCPGADIPASALNESETSMRASGLELDTADLSLEQRIQRLEDMQAIRNLKFTYWDCVDSRDWDRYRDVFAEDVHWECPGFNAVADGREGIIASARASLPAYVKSCHQGMQSYIEITSDTTAVGRWSFRDNLVNVRTNAEFNGEGYYDEEYTKIDGRWVIQSYRITYNMTDAKYLKSFALDFGPSQNIVFM